MKTITRSTAMAMFASTTAALFASPTIRAQVAGQSQYPNLPSETPAKFVTATDSFDYVKRTAMIPMRDGTKLFTVIEVPKGARGAPMLLTRTPYDAKGCANRAQSSHLGPIVSNPVSMPDSTPTERNRPRWRSSRRMNFPHPF